MRKHCLILLLPVLCLLAAPPSAWTHALVHLAAHAAHSTSESNSTDDGACVECLVLSHLAVATRPASPAAQLLVHLRFESPVAALASHDCLGAPAPCSRDPPHVG